MYKIRLRADCNIALEKWGEVGMTEEKVTKGKIEDDRVARAVSSAWSLFPRNCFKCAHKNYLRTSRVHSTVCKKILRTRSELHARTLAEIENKDRK